MIKRIRLKPKKAYGQKQILVHFKLNVTKNNTQAQKKWNIVDKNEECKKHKTDD